MPSSREMDEDPNVYIGLRLPVAPSETIPFSFSLIFFINLNNSDDFTLGKSNL